MPLRLARYGVPLAQTALAGLAAASIHEPMPTLTSPPPVADPEPLAPASAEHSRALETGELTEQAPHHQHDRQASDTQDAENTNAAQPEHLADVPTEAPAEATALELTADSDPRFPTVYTDYLHNYGDFPTARQFALYLADGYGIGDPSHGGPIAEKELVPVVKELRRRVEKPGGVDDRSVGHGAPSRGRDRSDRSRPIGHVTPLLR